MGITEILRRSLILVAIALPAAAPIRSEPGLPADWQSSALEAISAQEYAITWQDETAVADLPGAWHAANRAQDLRAYFSETGIRVVRRSEEPPTWEWSLTLSRHGRRGSELPVESARPTPRDNRVEYERDAIVEWYVNDARGLEQGFTLARASEPSADPIDAPVVLELALGGNLSAFPAEDGQSIDFKTAAGVSVLRYAELHVEDATGRSLPARMEAFAAGGERGIRLIFDDTGAVYPVTVDPLALSPAWTADGGQAGAQFGFSVSTAGDVNGDGYSDVIVGAWTFDNGHNDEGRAYVFLGSASGPSSSADWTAEGNQTGGYFAFAVATAGDVNGDGFDDVIVGAESYDNGQSINDNEGVGFVYHGSASGLGASPAWTAETNQAGGNFGHSVATAGDVNGDGFDDVIVGASNWQNNQVDEGGAFIYHGSASGLSAAPAWQGEGNQGSASLGSSVATAGDLNGDGYDDVIIGVPNYDVGASLDRGRALIYPGSSTGVTTTALWVQEGTSTSEYFGTSVGTAGDVNGDGYADVIVGAWTYDNGHTDEGRALVYHGSASGPSFTANWTVEGDQQSGYFGFSVATAGDVNGDGYADVIVGAESYDMDGALSANKGAAFIYEGSQNGLSVNAVWSVSGTAGAGLGRSVASAGDVDGDGYGDVIVGANGYTGTLTGEGRASVFRGSASGLFGAPSRQVESNQAGASLGIAVSLAGDVNGDGYSDVILGASGYDNGEVDEGRVFVHYGSAASFSSTPSWTAEGNANNALLGTTVAGAGDVDGDGYSDILIESLLPTGISRIQLHRGSASGLEPAPTWTPPTLPNQGFGLSLASAGDVNADGYADVIVGAPGYSNGLTGEGGAFVYLGSATGLPSSPSWSSESNQTVAQFGFAVASAGDVNRDGFSDVLIGANHYGNGQVNEGRSFLYLGSASGPALLPAWTAESDQAAAEFGHAVATAGDVNGDGYSDVIVGAPLYDNGQTDEGRAHVYLGSLSALGASPAWIGESNQADARFGFAVATAGDVNADGYSEVLVGAPRYSAGQTQEGRAYGYHGSATGLGAFFGWTTESNQANAHLGAAISTAGDVNGDGHPDVVVGVPEYSFPQVLEGIVFFYHGNWGDGIDRVPRQVRADGSAPIDVLGNSENQNSFMLRAHGRTPAGRGDIRVQWETQPLGMPFDGSGIATGEWVDTGSPVLGEGSMVPLELDIEDLTPGTPYRWRLRTLNDSPFFPSSPWLTLVYNNRTETDLRTRICIDLDGDGYGSPADSICPAGATTDCNDTQATVHPGGTEICDGLDNDCNGSVDGFATTCGVGACSSVGTCTAGVDSCAPGSPSAEICDNLDNDCNGTVDGFATTCGVGACSAAGTCTAGVNSCTPGSPSVEVCDNLDNDCNGAVDGFATTCGAGDCAAVGSCTAGADSCIPGGGAGSDTDGDGVGDDCDNCVGVFNPEQGNPIRLSAPMVAGSGIYRHALTPDGVTAVFIADQIVSGTFELFAVPTAGPASSAVKLNGTLAPGRNVVSVRISPNGTRVVYLTGHTEDEGLELFSVPIGGPAAAGVKLNGSLPSLGAVLLDFQISPDGARVVYRADQVNNDVLELFSVPIGGPAAAGVKLNGALVSGGDVESNVFDDRAAFRISPDSTRVFYAADQVVNNRTELFSVPIAGPSASGVKLNSALVSGGSVLEARVSPDSARVIYGAGQDVFNKQELYSVLATGGSVVKLNGPLAAGEQVMMENSSNGAVFTADGQLVVFVVASGSVSKLYRVPSAGGTATQLTPHDPWEFGISTDGSTVLYIAAPDFPAGPELYGVPIDGSASPFRVSDPVTVPGDGVAALFSDGRQPLYQDRVVYAVFTDSVPALYSALTDGSGSPVPLDQPMAPGDVLYGMYPRSNDQVVTYITSDESFTGFETFAVRHDGMFRAEKVTDGFPAYMSIAGDAWFSVYDHDADGNGGTEFYARRLNTDGDSILNQCDPCPLDVDNDADGDGLCADVDNCSDIANPGQGPVVFGQTVLASDAATFAWTSFGDVDYVRGPLDAVGAYATNLVGSLSGTTFVDLAAPAAGTGWYYLFAPGGDCEVGSWQSTLGAEPARDAALP